MNGTGCANVKNK